ncbi:hypothetical protein RVM25_37015, partial [Enterobacter hormaechei subsp. xiangfangensis]
MRDLILQLSKSSIYSTKPFSGLLIILLPLIAGYLIPLRHESAL